MSDDEKYDSGRSERAHDDNGVRNTNMNREDADHMKHLTEDELAIQKKLLRKVDSLIMPLVMLVSCSSLECVLDINEC